MHCRTPTVGVNLTLAEVMAWLVGVPVVHNSAQQGDHYNQGSTAVMIAGLYRQVQKLRQTNNPTAQSTV